MIVDDAPDTLLERGAAEVDQQADRLAGEAQIGQELFAMRGIGLVGGFSMKAQQSESLIGNLSEFRRT